MNTRIEILRDGVWYALELASKKAIEYNAVINTIGKVATREISHTNTFSIPYIQTNTKALGINIFNQSTLAKSLNQKYLAKYFVDDKIVRTGYVVINNTKRGSININFIDEALDLVDKWGGITYQELLKDTVIDIPADYEASIAELVDYDLDVNAILTPLTQVGTRGYNLCLFPNNLNAIGDEFQKDDDDLRQIDYFNPYQSRPVWNVKAMFDLACESYGYTPIYDDSVDWDYVATQYMIEEGQDKNEKGLNGLQTVYRGSVNTSAPFKYITPGFFGGSTFSFFDTLVLFPGSVSLKPNNIPGWIDPIWLVQEIGASGSTTVGAARPWMSQNCIFAADVTQGNVGNFVLTFRHGNTGITTYYYTNVYESPADDFDEVIFNSGFGQENDTTSGPMISGIVVTSIYSNLDESEITFDKAYLNNPVYGPGGSSLVLPTWTTNDFTDSGDGFFTKTTTTSGSLEQTGNGFASTGVYYQVRFTIEDYVGGDLDLEIGTTGSTSIGIQGNGKYVVDFLKVQISDIITLTGNFQGKIGDFKIHERVVCNNYLGTMVHQARGLASGSNANLSDMRITEEFLPPDTIAFDEFGQYLPSSPDLRHSAPRKSVKDLLSAYMHKDGILMDINGRAKTVKFFNYGEYEENKILEEYIDFSEYHLKYGGIEFNTDYGNGFAKLNRIGLNSPYPGNTYDYILDNQGEESKFKDFVENNNKLFKDIENVVSVQNIITPYFEYKNTGLGLVEYDGTLGTLTQARADGNTQGSFTGLAKLANVNFATLPLGTQYWYDLVDVGIRATASFLIPVDIMSKLDMSKPIYVEELGGYYIIEKVEQYVNAQTPVVIKLIKLIDNLRGLIDPGGGVVFPPNISLTATSLEPGLFGPFNYNIFTSTTFNNYTPVSATLEYRQIEDWPGAGPIEYTGYTVPYNFDFSTGVYTNLTNQLSSSIPITEFETGVYEMQVTDNTTGLQSALVYGSLGDLTVQSPSVNILVSSYTNSNLPVGTFRAKLTYNYHVPTLATLTYTKKAYIGGQALGQTETVNMLTNPNVSLVYNSSGELVSSTIDITPADGAGFYAIDGITNEATTPTNFLGGHFI